jgi:hypothetical protein
VRRSAVELSSMSLSLSIYCMEVFGLSGLF